MIKEDLKTATVHSFLDFAHAQGVVKDFPTIISLYEKLLPQLYPFAHFHAAYTVIQSVEDALTLCHIQHDFYSQIYKNKGIQD